MEQANQPIPEKNNNAVKVIALIIGVIVLVALVVMWKNSQTKPRQETPLNQAAVPVAVNATNQPAQPVQPTTPAKPVVPVAKVNLAAIYLNDTADSNGTVSVHKATFTPQTVEIFTSAYIEKAEVGLKITAVLSYLPTGDQVGPVTNEANQAGDIISNFSFTKPTAGWPTGDYKINISLSDGQTKDVVFSVK